MKRVVTDGLIETLDPLLLFLLVGGRHSIHGMLTLDHLTLGVGFACFDDFRSTAGMQLEAELFAAVLHFADL